MWTASENIEMAASILADIQVSFLRLNRISVYLIFSSKIFVCVLLPEEKNIEP